MDSAGPDMLSLAFLFEPEIQSRIDRSGLSKLSTAKSHRVSEADLAIDLLGVLVKIEDIDRTLHDDPELNEKTISKMEKILKAAHYDTTNYRKWSNSNTPNLEILE